MSLPRLRSDLCAPRGGARVAAELTPARGGPAYAGDGTPAQPTMYQYHADMAHMAANRHVNERAERESVHAHSG
eukprot:1812941-Prymnesium_polylepis.1